MEIGIPLIIVALVLFVVGMLLRRQRAQRAEFLSQADDTKKGDEADVDLTRPRPKVAELHVLDNEAQVTFNVPVPDEPDDVLTELLVNEAIEVVREKRHSLPMGGVTAVVALAGRPGSVREVGRAKLDTPGELPPRTEVPPLLNLSHIAADPLEADLAQDGADVPGTVTPVREDTLRPLIEEIRIPRAVETGLRTQGVDPSSMSAGELVTGMLSLVGYQVTPGIAELTYFAQKGGQRTFIREDPYQAGDHPEVDSDTIRRFMIEFGASGADRGLFVSEKYGPFEVYEKERREPRVKFVTRERLQKLIDALALG